MEKTEPRPGETLGGRRAATAKAVAKGLLAIVALAVVLHNVDFGDLVARLGRLGVADVALLVGLYALQTAIGVARWWRLLRRLGERVPYVALCGDVLVGLTFNMFLPTNIGGDVVRAVRARRRVAAPHHAWSTSIFERIAGLVALGAVGGVAATAGFGEAAALPGSLRMTAAGVAAALVVVFFLAAAPFRVLAHVLEKRLPAAATDDMRGIVRDLEGPLAAAPARLEAVAWSVIAQAVGLLFVIVGAAALGAPGHGLAIAIGMPLVFVFQMVPLTLGGHGLREGLYVGILGALGVPGGVALGLAAMFLAASVLFAGVGAAVMALEGPGAKR